MTKRICGRCRSTDIEENSLRGEVIWCNCNRCKYFAKVAEFPEQTIFDCVTQSPETLAENSVYVHVVSNGDGDGEPEYFFATPWTAELYETIEAAVAAATARLKEVYVNDKASCNTAESEREDE